MTSDAFEVSIETVLSWEVDVAIVTMDFDSWLRLTLSESTPPTLSFAFFGVVLTSPGGALVAKPEKI